MNKKKQAKKAKKANKAIKAIKYEGGAEWYVPAGTEDMLCVRATWEEWNEAYRLFCQDATNKDMFMRHVKTMANKRGDGKSILEHMIEAENGDNDC